MKNIPILTFIARYWLIIAITVALYLASKNEEVFRVVGGPLQLAIVSGVAGCVTLFAKHIFFRQSIDADISSGFWLTKWNEFKASPLYIPVTLGVLCAMFIGVCIIAAAVAK